MKTMLALLALLSSLTLPAQFINLDGTTTRAVVIGISDYQDEQIPDLRFADRDAEAFAQWLRSPAGGSLQEDKIKVLTNKDATTGKMIAALDGLIVASKPGDEAIIYFSGHGDVERVTKFQRGFLLTYDSPPAVYAAGAFSLQYLQDIVTTLSEAGVQAVVITDACRAGKLAGSEFGGSKATSAALAQQFANEIKILSCQPEEFSLEGEQWGGGRGCFSYHLVDALYGMADANTDGTVNLLELGRYLEEKVPTEAAPHSQIPFTVGNRATRLAMVDAEALAQWRQQKDGEAMAFKKIDSRGLEDLALAKADTGILKMYHAFTAALEAGSLMATDSTAGKSADDYYKLLIKEPSIAELHGLMTRNFAAALMDDSQKWLNAYLKTDMHYLSSKENRTERFREYPLSLKRSAELLNEKHYLYKTLQARMYYFEGKILADSKIYSEKESGEKALAMYRLSLELLSDQPYVYFSIGEAFAYRFHQLDSAEYFINRAIQLAPKWILPLTELAWLNFTKNKQPEQARFFLENANQIDSNSIVLINTWGNYYEELKQYNIAEYYYKKAISIDPTISSSYFYLAQLYEEMKRNLEAEQLFLKFIQNNPTNAFAYSRLGNYYAYIFRNTEAEIQFLKSIQLDAKNCYTYYYLGNLYANTDRFNEAEKQLQKAISCNSGYFDAHRRLSDVYVSLKRFDDAVQVILQAITIDSTQVKFYVKLGRIYKRKGEYEAAELQFKKAITLDSTFTDAYVQLGVLFYSTHRLADADIQFTKAIFIDSTNSAVLRSVASAYLSLKKYEDAEVLYLKSIQINDDGVEAAYYDLACLKSLQNQISTAFEYLEKSLLNGWDDYDWMNEDSDLAPLQKRTKQWKALMKKYFPDQVKD